MTLIKNTVTFGYKKRRYAMATPLYLTTNKKH